jgi:hypothetical protein
MSPPCYPAKISRVHTYIIFPSRYTSHVNAHAAEEGHDAEATQHTRDCGNAQLACRKPTLWQSGECGGSIINTSIDGSQDTSETHVEK